MSSGDSKKEPNSWEKADIVLKAISAIGIGFLGIAGPMFLDRAQKRDADARLYAELMSRREDAESGLRKDMFSKIIDSIVGPETNDLDKKVLDLELLTYNFHESLNLKPLFEHVMREIDEQSVPTNAQPVPTNAQRDALRHRLEKVAREIAGKQAASLATVGQVARVDFYFDCCTIAATLDTNIVLPAGKSQFGPLIAQVTLSDPDSARRTVRVHLQIRTRAQKTLSDQKFELSYLDFPMIDNTRLPGDERCAAVLEGFVQEEDVPTAYNVQVSLLRFAGLYAGLRDQPYYDEIRSRLGAQSARLEAAGAP